MPARGSTATGHCPPPAACMRLPPALPSAPLSSVLLRPWWGAAAVPLAAPPVCNCCVRGRRVAGVAECRDERRRQRRPSRHGCRPIRRRHHSPCPFLPHTHASYAASRVVQPLCLGGGGGGSRGGGGGCATAEAARAVATLTPKARAELAGCALLLVAKGAEAAAGATLAAQHRDRLCLQGGGKECG